MNQPKWISREMACVIHSLVSGDRATELVDRDALDEAIQAPKDMWMHRHVDLADLASAYLCEFGRRGPWRSDNAATAWMICVRFIQNNGTDVVGYERDGFAVITDAARGAATVAHVAEWLRAHIVGFG